MQIIGITGGTASGKTILVQKMVAHYGNKDIAVLSQDSYYKNTSLLSISERSAINFDHPNAIDFDLFYEHLLMLKNGTSIESPIYSFVEHNRTLETETILPKKMIVVEGILIFNDPRIVNLLDLKIFVDASEQVRLQRRINRDSVERGRNANEVKNRFEKTLKPMHNLYIEPSKKIADILIQNNTNVNDSFELLIKSISNSL